MALLNPCIALGQCYANKLQAQRRAGVIKTINLLAYRSLPDYDGIRLLEIIENQRSRCFRYILPKKSI